MNLFTLYAKLGLDTSEYEKGIGQSRKSMTALAQSISAKTVAIGTMAAHAIEGVGKAMISLGKSSIQASADIEAEIALYEQVFGELESAAGGVLESISKDTNILATRLRGIGTSAFMQFKGAGVDAASALTAMDKYTRLAADAAAAFNISIEDADVRLRSFLRGNTEAGDAIGLFTSESQRNERAIATYGQKWLDLTEAQKQMLMLNVVEELYAQQEVLGQAAREGHSWENVIADLNEAFRIMNGTVGNSFRKALIPVIEKLTELLTDDTFILRVGMLASGLGDIAGYVFTGVIDFIDQLLKWSNGEGDPEVYSSAKSVFDAAAKIANAAFEGFGNLVKWAVELGQSGADAFFTAFSALTGNQSLEETLTNITTFFEDVIGYVTGNGELVKTFFATITGGLALANWPALLFIGSLTLIASNWTTIKEKATEAFETIVNWLTVNIGQPVEDFRKNVIDAIKKWWNETIPNAVQSAINAVGSFLGLDLIPGWDDITNSIMNAWANVSETIQSAIDKVREFLGIDKAREDNSPTNPYGSNYHVSNGKGAFENIASGLKSLIGLDTGLDYVPFDNYLARLHEGEAVLTKAEATNWRRGETTGTVDTAGIASAVAVAVREALDGVGVYMGAERVGDLVTDRVSRNIAKNTWNRRYQTT